MTGFNFYSHGSQDIYPSMIQESKGLSSHDATLATIVGNVGAICTFRCSLRLSVAMRSLG